MKRARLAASEGSGGGGDGGRSQHKGARHDCRRVRRLPRYIAQGRPRSVTVGTHVAQERHDHQTSWSWSRANVRLIERKLALLNAQEAAGLAERIISDAAAGGTYDRELLHVLHGVSGGDLPGRSRVHTPSHKTRCIFGLWADLDRMMKEEMIQDKRLQDRVCT